MGILSTVICPIEVLFIYNADVKERNDIPNMKASIGSSAPVRIANKTVFSTLTTPLNQ